MVPEKKANNGLSTSDRPPIAKTFIEGSPPKQAHSPLTGSARLDVTSLRASKPFGQQGSQEITDQNMLPNGNEKIPLGSGTIRGVLGTGGMARVYKIWNEKLEVFRAVKILLPTQQKDLRNRFETEGKITAKLHHPNIVEIYNVGDWNGLPYIEMEYVDGDSLEAIVAQRGKLPYVVGCAVAIFIARALVYAHGQEFLIYGNNYHGIIHRDLKPANIMISKTGDVKLMDFGIARPTETSLHTVDGNIVGTMQYLSPEQIDGIDIDCRTDIYSFGTIVYELLAGTKTFPQDTITHLIKKKIINEYRKFTDLDIFMPTVLARIIQKCLQANKEHRYSSAKVLLSELEAALKTMSLDDPSEILREYLDDPANYIAPAERKTIKIATPFAKKMMFPMVGALIFLAVVGGFVVTMMTRKTIPKQGTVTSSLQPAKALPVTTSLNENGLKPLSGALRTSKTPGVQHPNPIGVKKQPATPASGTMPTSLNPVSTNRNVISMDKLAKKYGTFDLLAIGRSALNAGNETEAIFALEALPDKNTDTKIKSLLLLEAYVESDRKKDALFIATSQSIQDAHFDNLCGRLYQSLGKNTQALECFETALTKPSIIRNRSEIRNDALYYSAVVRSELYYKDPTTDSHELAINSWNIVKKLYVNNQHHARYKQAEKELSLLK